MGLGWISFRPVDTGMTMINAGKVTAVPVAAAHIQATEERLNLSAQGRAAASGEAGGGEAKTSLSQAKRAFLENMAAEMTSAQRKMPAEQLRLAQQKDHQALLDAVEKAVDNIAEAFGRDAAVDCMDKIAETISGCFGRTSLGAGFSAALSLLNRHYCDAEAGGDLTGQAPAGLQSLVSQWNKGLEAVFSEGWGQTGQADETDRSVDSLGLAMLKYFDGKVDYARDGQSATLKMFSVGYTRQEGLADAPARFYADWREGLLMGPPQREQAAVAVLKAPKGAGNVDILA